MDRNLSYLQLILLPPVGGTARTFYPQLSLPCKVIPSDPIEWRKDESIAAHAKRLLNHLKQDGRIDFSRPVVFGGLSLGGALAQELTLLHPPAGLILMATFSSSKELAPFIRLICQRAHRLPLVLYKISESLAPIGMRMLSYMTLDDIRMMSSEYRTINKNWFRNALKAIGEWQGPKQRLDVPSIRIHGISDPLIPIKRIPHVDHKLDTMHLLSLSRATEVNKLIENFLLSLSPETSTIT